MLQFLPMIGTALTKAAPFLSAGANLLGAASSARNVSRGYVPPPADPAQQAALEMMKQQLAYQGQATANQNRLTQALLNPDDTVYKNLVAGEGRELNSAVQRQLQNMLMADRKGRLMGRGSFFNPERQDEAISQFLSQKSDEIAGTSRSNALQRILSAAQQYGSAASGYGTAAGGYNNMARSYGGLIPQQLAAQNQNAAVAPNLFGAAADLLKPGGSMSNIFGMLAGKGTPWLNPDTGRYV